MKSKEEAFQSEAVLLNELFSENSFSKFRTVSEIYQLKNFYLFEWGSGFQLVENQIYSLDRWILVYLCHTISSNLIEMIWVVFTLKQM